MNDREKRKRVMERSMRLGHCVCNPRQPCPCDTLREKDICPCAGERFPESAEAVRLTELVDSPGCASKIDQATLKRVLDGLPSLADPRVLVGMPAGDDAGIYQLDEHSALVQTVDVFAPSVDDPYTFGQIAAANSLSDVYAMGGRPITALSIIGFPVGTLPDEALRAILRGGIDKMAEAGVPVIGGHSINDAAVKAGFAVTGLVDPRQMLTNAAAEPGDRLLLTKPLGTGIVAFAAQIGRLPAGAAEEAARSMAELNRRAAELMLQFHAHACTDVTGFGLMGHLAALAAASRVDVEIALDELPLLPGVRQCAAQGIFPGAVERNREASASAMVADEGLSPSQLDLCFDPQTSGGLLIAAAPAAAVALLARLHAEGMSTAAVIGRVVGSGAGRVFVRGNKLGADSGCAKGQGFGDLGFAPGPQLPGATAGLSSNAAGCGGGQTTGAAQRRAEDLQEAAAPATLNPPSTGPSSITLEEKTEMSDCCGEHGAVAGSVVSAARQKYKEFVELANAPGALDARTKQAVALALSVAARCEPCVKHHVQKARQMGFSEDEIDEAAWMAIAFGGSPVMTFYNAARKA
jgi:selenide,water dikinase